MTLPHRQEKVEPTPMESGLLSGVFNARAPRNPDPATIISAERAFKAGEDHAADATARRQATADTAHARYRDYEGVLETSYKSRGLEGDLDRMSFGTRKGLINAAAKIGEIFEVAEEGREAIQEIGEAATKRGTSAIDRISANTDRRFDALQAKIAEVLRR